MRRSFRLAVLVYVALLSTLVADGATFTNFVGFGSVSNAIAQYAMPNLLGLSIGVYQNTWEGPVDVSDPKAFNIKKQFQTEDALNAFFRQQTMLIAQGALTNIDVDKDQPLHIFALISGVSSRLGIINYLYSSEEFYLGRSVIDGSYYVPSFSDYSLRLESTMVYEPAGLEWARIEAIYNPALNPNDNSLGIIYEDDPRYNPPIGIHIDEGYIEIPTYLATSGTEGPTLIRVSLVTHEGTNHVFRVFGASGMQVPELPIYTTDFKVVDNEVSFGVSGGETGRILKVQWSPTPCGPWYDVGQEFSVPRRGYTPIQFVGDMQEQFGFYRTTSVNKSPF